MIPTSLYEISNEIAAILGEEEWDDQTEAKLDALGLAMEVKAKNILGFCADLAAFADAAKAEENRISARRKAAENRVASLKAYLKSCMEQAGRTEVEAGTHSLKIQANPPAVVVDDETTIPPRFFVIIPETKKLDKKLVAEALKKGEEVKGAHLERGTSLWIR